MSLKLCPIFQRDARAFVNKYHRHHKAPVGSIFQIACCDHGDVVGVLIAGRPVARNLQDGLTIEVTRLVTLGHRNACSFLYSAAWRVAKNLGYHRIITYILENEIGSSLKASGWHRVGPAGGGSWSRSSRPRVGDHPLCLKVRYEKNIRSYYDD